MRNTLVVGASGLLGRVLMDNMGATACGTTFTRAGAGLLPLDARNAEAVLAVVRAVRPRVVVNLVAERRPAHWESAESLHATNVTTAANTARAAKAVGAFLIHVSTDYVFPSGGPYSVDAPHAPTNAYGRTKSEAETAVRRESQDAVVVRMPVLYGPVRHFAECNVSELVRRVATGTEPLLLDTWARRRPTHVADVAQTLSRIASSVEHWAGRSMHLSAKQWYTQYDMGCLIAELLATDPERIVKTQNAALDRPRQVELKLDERTPHLTAYRSLSDGLPALIEGYLAAS